MPKIGRDPGERSGRMQNTPSFLQRQSHAPAPVGAGAPMDDEDDDLGNR
jgi:hypothetical protein